MDKDYVFRRLLEGWVHLLTNPPALAVGKFKIRTTLRFFKEPGLYKNYVLPLYSEGKYKDLVLLFALGEGE